MKKLVCAFLLLIICSLLINCSGNPEPQELPDIEQTKESRYTALLEKFEAISLDTLFIYNEKEFDKFKGVRVDSNETALFPKKFLFEHYSIDQGIFACFKFPIDTERTGLIARTPAFYHPSSLKLFVYNSKKDEITNAIEVAELWGDAGSSSNKASWIYKDESGRLRVLISLIETQDLSILQEEDYRITHMGRNGIFSEFFLYDVELSETEFDTVSKNVEVLKKQFAPMLKKSDRFNIIPLKK